MYRTFPPLETNKLTNPPPFSLAPPNFFLLGRFGGTEIVSPYSLHSSPVSSSVPIDPQPSVPYTAELGRKGLHLLALVIPLGMWWVGMPTALYMLVPGALLAISADIARAYSHRFNALIRWVFGFLMRADELPPVGTVVRFNGATCVLVGATVLALIFPLWIAVPVLVMAMLADAAAALVGRRLGRHHWGPWASTVEGTAAFLGTGLLVILFFPSLTVGPAIAGVVGAAIVEALPLPFNDNIHVPLVAALIVAVGEAVVVGRPIALFGGVLS